MKLHYSQTTLLVLEEVFGFDNHMKLHYSQTKGLGESDLDKFDNQFSNKRHYTPQFHMDILSESHINPYLLYTHLCFLEMEFADFLEKEYKFHNAAHIFLSENSHLLIYTHHSLRR